MNGFYDTKLVALSLIVAIIASYTALQLAGHVSRKRGKESAVWLAGGAIAMGVGIWSMHFVGMLAFHLPIAIAYDAGLTMLSMAIAIVVSGVALALVRHPVQRLPHLIAGGVAMGIGISAMHYTGMYAMQMSPGIEYDPLLFTLSVIIAIVASMAALWIAFRLRDKQFGVAVLAKLGSAVIMGIAITGMHYTGMAAAQFLPGSVCLAIDSTGGMQRGALATTIVATTAVILSVALWVAALDARFIRERKRGVEELLRFGAAMDATADAIHLIDRATMRFVHVNAAGMRMLGLTHATIADADPAAVLGVPRETLERSFDALIAGDASLRNEELKQPLPDGSARWLEVRRHALNSEEGWTVVTLVRDITEQKSAADRIAHLNRVYAMLSAVNTLIVRVRDRDALFREACRIAVDQGGFRMSWIAIVDRDAMRIVPVASAGASDSFMERLARHFEDTDGPALGRSLVAAAIRDKKVTVLKDLQTNPVFTLRDEFSRLGVHSTAIFPLVVGDQGVGAFSLFSPDRDFFKGEELDLLGDLANDIAFAIDHIDSQERLDYLAYYDVLTGLANRALFLDRVAQWIRGANGKRRLGVFVVDLQRFKDINDSLGRPAGDAVLRQAGALLAKIAGDPRFVARVGSNHFAVLLPQIRDDGDLNRLLDKQTAAFASHRFELNGSFFHLTVRVGGAIHPDDGATADDLFRDAEAALKKAKATGERWLFYAPGMTNFTAATLALESHLRQAIDRNEFVVHYQPKVDLLTRRLTGVEGLLRWNDPREGLRPPADFIPILEESGLIHDVGRWVLKQAVNDYGGWPQSEDRLQAVAINVSPLQLRHRNFVADIERIVRGMPSGAPQLELEITESVIMEDVEHSIAILEAVRALGVRIAIDDFGTGFSSLNYLSKLPLDTLKVDRSFVSDITNGPQGVALVSTIITLAHALKLKVVAEGVETEQQAALLQSLGCDEMQGYLVSRAVDFGSFRKRYLRPAELSVVDADGARQRRRVRTRHARMLTGSH